MDSLKLLSRDPVFTTVLETINPLKLPKSGDVFNELVKAIAYQQISYKAADTIYGRFLDLIGKEKFKPKDLLKLKVEEMRAVGFSIRKAEYSHNIAQFFLDNELYNYDWSKLTDEQIVKLLTQIKGVGEWTVQMILIFELHREDVFPHLDLAIQQSIQELYNLKSEKKKLYAEMKDIAENWRPHRTLATLYLWGWKREQARLKKKMA